MILLLNKRAGFFLVILNFYLTGPSLLSNRRGPWGHRRSSQLPRWINGSFHAWEMNSGIETFQKSPNRNFPEEVLSECSNIVKYKNLSNFDFEKSMIKKSRIYGSESEYPIVATFKFPRKQDYHWSVSVGKLSPDIHPINLWIFCLEKSMNIQ